MKRIAYLTAVLSLIVVSMAFAQENHAEAITFGGGRVSGTDYDGSITIGLPFVGQTVSTSGDTARLGLYNDTSSKYSGVERTTIEAARVRNVFPNPTTGDFRILPPDGVGKILRIALLDITGKEVEDITHLAVTGADGVHIKVKGLVAGAYFLRLDGGSGSELYKLIVRE